MYIHLGARPLWRTTLTALGLMVLPVSIGCDPSVVTDPTNAEIATTDEPLMQTGVERTIPITFYVMSAAGAQSNATDKDAYGAVDLANNTWAGSGVQYYVNDIARLQLDLLYDTSDYTTTYSWSQIANDVHKFLPGVAEFGNGRAAPKYVWESQIAARLPHNVVPVFVHSKISCVTNCSAFPHQDGAPSYPSPNGDGTWTGWSTDASHGIGLTVDGGPNAFDGGRLNALAHELGHYMGLAHTFDFPIDRVNEEGDNPWDYFDLVYDTSKADVTPFPSRAAAKAAFDADHARLARIDTGNIEHMSKACTFKFTYTNPAKTYTSDVSPANLYGVVFDSYLPYENDAMNVMSYLARDAVLDPCPTRFSGSQIEIAKRHLRSSKGQRNELGSGDYQSAFQASGAPWAHKVDFDGDGVRDLAAFRRTSNGAPYNRCVVYSVGKGTSSTIDMSAVAQVGDTPIAADFDLDNKTDCGLIRRDFVAHTSTWLWRSSLTGELRSFTLDAGSDHDVALPGLRMTTAGGTAIVSYRPTTAKLSYWISSSTKPYTSWSSKSEIALPLWGGRIARILPGKYDNDGLTDFAIYMPSASAFSLVRSGNSYQGSPLWYPGGMPNDPTHVGDVVLPGVDKDGDGNLDYAVWQPATARWYYHTNPGTGASQDITVGWGAPDDIPISGYDFDGDKKADELVYRMSGDTGAAGKFFVINSSNGLTFSIPFGSATDWPFATADEDGDGKAELYIFHAMGQSWQRARSKTGWALEPATQWGNFTDLLF